MKNIFLTLLILGGVYTKAEPLASDNTMSTKPLSLGDAYITKAETLALDNTMLINALDEAYSNDKDVMITSKINETLVSLMAAGYSISNISYDNTRYDRDICTITINLQTLNGVLEKRAYSLFKENQFEGFHSDKNYSATSNGYKQALKWCFESVSK